MKTKTKKRVTRQAVTRPASSQPGQSLAAAPVAAVPSIVVHVHPAKVEFHAAAPGGVTLESRCANGAVNSDAFVKVERRIIAAREAGASLSFRFFNAQGAEIPASQADAKDVALTQTLL